MIKSNGARTILLRTALLASILSLLNATGCKRSKEIDVDSQPPGASVYIDDNLAGQTPTRVTIAATAQNLRVVSPGETFHQKAAKITSRTLKTAYTPLTANLPLFVAMEKGYFAQNGIEVQAIEVTSPNDILTGIVSGDLDFAAVLAYTILFPGANRYPGKFKLFSSCEETSTHFTSSIIARTDSPIKSPSDLRGKKIGVYTGLVQINFLKAILVGIDIDPSEVQIVEISPRLQIQGLVSGEYDALSSTEPTTNIAILQGIAKVEPFAL